MALGYSMMQGRVSLVIGCVERAPGFEEEIDHGHGTNGCCAVEGVLAALVTDSGGGGGFLLEQELAR